jgi:hypothetical protein
MDAVFALIGGLAGAALFAHLHEVLIPLLYEPTNVGQITLVDWTGSTPITILLLTVVFGGCIAVINMLWDKKDNV